MFTKASIQVRDRGRDLKAAANGWMRPEIRHNMAGPLSLADEVKRGPDTEREERAQVWQRAHCEWARVRVVWACVRVVWAYMYMSLHD